MIVNHEVFMRFARPKTHENVHFRSSAYSSGLGAARLRFGNSLPDGDAVPSRRSDDPPKLRTEFSEEGTKFTRDPSHATSISAGARIAGSVSAEGSARSTRVTRQPAC